MARNSRTGRNRKLSNLQKILQTDTKKVICILLIFFLIFLISYIVTKLSITTESNEAINYDAQKVLTLESEADTIDTSINLSLCAIGDVMCHNTQYWDAYNKNTGEYDFSYVFENIKDYTQSPDITIASLETSFAGEEKGYSNYPTFNSPDNLAYCLSNIGVDIVSTAGNHCLDMGFSGLCRTIDVLDKFNISHLGTYKTKEDSQEILYKNINGLKIAFVNYTYGTNGIPLPTENEYCVNLIDKTLIKSQLNKAKSEGANIIVACMHWGTEYKITANSEQQDLAGFLFQNGADIILGNHPHTLEPMEKVTITLEDGSTQDGFIIYALGNFICDQNAENTRNSIILNLDITYNDNKLSINKVSYIPIYMYKNPNVSTQKFKVLDIIKSISDYENGSDTSIGSSEYENLKIQLQKIKSIVGEELL